MAFMRHLYPQYLLLLILFCLSCVLFVTSTEAFVDGTLVKSEKSSRDDLFSFYADLESKNDLDLPSKLKKISNNDAEQDKENDKNVLDTLKVILKKVKTEVVDSTKQNDNSEEGFDKNVQTHSELIPTSTLDKKLSVPDQDDFTEQLSSDITESYDGENYAGDVYRTDSPYNPVKIDKVLLKSINKNVFLEKNGVSKAETIGKTPKNSDSKADLSGIENTVDNGKKQKISKASKPSESNNATDNELKFRSSPLTPHEKQNFSIFSAGNKTLKPNLEKPDSNRTFLEEKRVPVDDVVGEHPGNNLGEEKGSVSDNEEEKLNTATLQPVTDPTIPAIATKTKEESRLGIDEIEETVSGKNVTSLDESVVNLDVVENATEATRNDSAPFDEDGKGNLSDEPQKEQDQLETYSQFAERVTAEKKNGVVGTNGHGNNGQSGKGPKVKSKNYASMDCGAKFLAANPESTYSHKIINSNKDEYMLNKCTGKIWAIVELCESIRPQKFDIANFELFSNSPKDIYLYGSHRYPTRDWVPIGAYEGKEGNRDIQSFNIETQEFFKYIKLEVHSYYGTEFFCPLSLFRMYGLSEFEVIEETEDNEEEQIAEEEPEEHTEEEKKKDTAGHKGMIPDVIKSMLSGILQVIKRGSRSGNITDEPELNSFTQSCSSLHSNFAIKKESCFFAESVNYILACYYDEYVKLMTNPFIATFVQNSNFCHQLAQMICTSPNSNDTFVYDSVCNNSYACVMLSPKHILAMCHMYDPLIIDANSAVDSCRDAQVPENVSTVNEFTNSIDTQKSANITIPLLVKEEERSSKSVDTVTEKQNHKEVKVEATAENEIPEDVPPSSESISAKEALGEKTEKVLNLTRNVSKKKDEMQEKEKTVSENVQLVEQTDPSVVAEEPEKPNGTHKIESKKKVKDQKAEKDISTKSTLGEDASTSQTPSATLPTTAAPPTLTEGRVGSHSNKESIVVRLSNKIKVLEHNMSISSQYLEELSRTYKRQMEDMQRQFNITIVALNSTSQKAYERDLYHQNRLERLETQLEEVLQLVTKLSHEKDDLLTRVIKQHMILFFVEILVICIVFGLCFKRRREELRGEDGNQNVNGNAVSNLDEMNGSVDERRGTPRCRRRSVDSIRKDSESKPKERRFSGHLPFSGCYQDLLIQETTTKEKKRKKKKVRLERSLSNASVAEKPRSSSVQSKKERKLEKLKRSSAGVIFSGEQRPEDGVIFGQGGVEEVQNGIDDWHVVRKSRSRVKHDPSTAYYLEPVYVASDLNRSKITLDDVYQHQLYDHPSFQEEYTVYDKGYLDMEYYGYLPQVDLSCNVEEPVNGIYNHTDYNSPVINNYYHAVEETPPQWKKDRRGRSSPNTQDNVDSPVLWDHTNKIPRSLTKTSSLSEFRTPPAPHGHPHSFKGKTKLRSDNWEWYSNQQSRVLANSGPSSADVVRNSTSDSVKQEKKENEIVPKIEKKGRRKGKKPKHCNGENT